MADDDESSVRVAVRVRPLSGREKVDRCDECVSVLEAEQQIVMGKNRSFTYDYVFGQYAQQSDIWRCVEPLTKAVFDGYNSTVFAYGQTGSGKTYTMGSASSVHIASEDYGIIPRVISHIFDQIDAKAAENSNYKAEVRVRFLEIYGEEIRDLLVTMEAGSDSKVTLREGEHGEVQVAGATEEIVEGGDGCLRLLERGSLARTTGSTLMNATSSRSHAIFTVSMVQQLPLAASGDGEELPEGDFETRRSYFNFVDLAGSERQKRTQAEGKRLKEGIDINKGLLALGNVISALGDDKKRGKVHVPYRDSKLTRMLQDSLGGNSRTLMLTCVSPADVNFDETLNALKYANRARNIKNKPVVNRDEASALTLELRRQVEMLQAEVLRLRNPGMSDSELKLTAPSPTLARVQTDFESYASMRARAENAEVEVARLTSELKRNKNQLDCMREEVFAAQTERDMLRIELKERGGTVMPPEERESTSNVIKDHLRAIHDLQEKLKLANGKKDLIDYSDPVFPGHQDTLGGQSSAIPLPSYIEEDVKQRAELIASLEKDLEVERNAASKQRIADASEDSADASDGTLDGSADDEFPTGMDIEASAEEADRLRVFENRQRHLGETYEDLSTNISEKERVYKSLKQAQANFAHMRTLYEQKLAVMSEEARNAQAERDKLAEEIRELEHKIQSEGGAPVNNGRLAMLTKELKAKDEQLETMLQKKREMDTAINKMKSADDRARRMKNEIESMKRQKVDLKKQMQDERKRYMEDAKQRAREIQALKRSQQRDKQQIAKLGSQKEAQERVLKRKMEEVTATKQKLKQQQQLTAQARRMNAAHGRKPSTMKKAERDAKWLSEEVKKRAEEQRKLEQLQREREAVAKEMETLYAQRNKLEEELRAAAASRNAMAEDAPMQPSPLGRRSKRQEQPLSPEEEQLIFDLEEQIEACQARLEYKEEKISEIADDGNAGTSAALLKIANAQSLSEMRTMLKTLFGTAIEVKKEDTLKEQELAKLKVEMAELTARLEQEHNKSVQIKQSYEESLRRVVQSSSEMMEDEEPMNERSRILLSVSEERNTTLQNKCEELENVYKSVENENQQLKSKLDRDERKLLESRERIIWLEEQLEKLKTFRPSNQTTKEGRARVLASAARAQSLPNVRDKSGPAEFGPASWANEQDDDDDGMESGDQGDPVHDEDVVMRDENDDSGAFHATFPGRARREYRVDVDHLSDDIDAGPRSQRGRRTLITSRRNDGDGDDGDDAHQYYRSESPTVASDDASSSTSIFSRLANPTNFTGIHKNRVRESVTKRELLQRSSDQKRSRRLKDRNQMRPPRAMTPTERSGGSFTFKAPPKKSGSILEVLENIKRENESERLTGTSGLRQPTAYGADRSREHSGDDEGSFGGTVPPPAPADVYSRLAGQYTASAQNKLKQPQPVRRVKHDDGDGELARTPSHASASASHFDDGDDEFVDAHDEIDEDYDPLLGGSSLVEQVHADYRERLSQRGKSGTSAEV